MYYGKSVLRTDFECYERPQKDWSIVKTESLSLFIQTFPFKPIKHI